MTGFLQILIPFLVWYLAGLGIAFLIWGRDETSGS
jgi:hypothetical protein